MITTHVETKLNGFMAGDKNEIQVINILRASKYIMLAEYKRETPVNKGTARRFVVARDTRDGFEVDNPVRAKGRRYMDYVGLGTGRFKNDARDWPSTGRIRSGESKIFKGTGGIRPNKFHIRGAENARPKIFKFVVNELKKL